jgi:hypothetical protein
LEQQFQVVSVDITPSQDIVVGFSDAELAQQLCDSHFLELLLEDETETIFLPVGPVVPQGLINHRRYLARCRTTYGIGHERILQCLKGNGFKVCHLVVGNLEIHGQSAPICQDGIDLYLEFETVEQALNMQDRFIVAGHEIRLWHKGRYTCAGCGMKGHKEEKCQEVQMQMARNRERRAAYRARKDN